MSYLITGLFVVAGVINLAPLSGVLSVEQLSRLYQVEAIPADMALLLRHRAVLFGIVGSILIAAGFVSSLRLVAFVAGLVSMISFILLVFATKNGNPSLIQIAWIDVGATIALLAGFGVHLATSSQ